MALKRLAPVHPGDILGEILDDLNISAYALAKSIGKAPIQVSRILAGRSAVTASMARLIAEALGTSAEMWMNLQSQFDLEKSKIDTPELRITPLVADGNRVGCN